MATHPGAVPPTEQTPEFLALERSCETLITGMKMDPISVCNALVSEGLIPPLVREYCSSSAKLDSEKSQKLFNTIMDRVEINPAVYHKIMAKLESHKWLEDCLDIIRRNYEAEKAKAKTPKETKKATAKVHGVQKKRDLTLTAFNFEVEIEGEHYTLDKSPDVNSKIVISELEPFHVTDFVTEVSGLIRLLNNATIATGPRFTQQQRDVQRLMYGIFSLYDKSAVTAAKANNFFSIFTSAIRINNEKTGLEYLHTYSKLASEMQKVALQTMREFENEKEKCTKQREEMLILRRNEDLTQCQTEEFLQVVKAIRSAINVLRHLSLNMWQGELFWQDMHDLCSRLATCNSSLTSQAETALYRYTEEKRLELHTSKPYKTKVILAYARWVALRTVCNDYIVVIGQKRKYLEQSIDENPSTEESRSNLKELEEKTFCDQARPTGRKLRRR